MPSIRKLKRASWWFRGLEHVAMFLLAESTSSGAAQEIDLQHASPIQKQHDLSFY